MFYIRIADLCVQIHNQYEYVRLLCEDYIVKAPDTEPDIVVSVTPQELQDELTDLGGAARIDYVEGVCMYRNICKQLPSTFDAYLLHCAVIEYEGQGYAFAAKSGTGKSTHISLWQKRFGNTVHIVNGDKPILRFVGNQLYAYGTPWCGKEGFQTNTSVPLKAICFLERDTTNSIRPISAGDAVMRIFHQILTPKDVQEVDSLFPLLDRTLKTVPCYLLGCNISEEAAEVAYLGMNQKGKGTVL